MILPVKIGRGRKWGRAWSERYDNQNTVYIKGKWFQSSRITPSMLKMRFLPEQSCVNLLSCHHSKRPINWSMK